MAPVNPEGQTAQEVLHELVEAIYWSGASPLPDVRESVAGRFNKALGEAKDVLDRVARARALASTPSPAEQTEQKIASAEGAASQLGAAPATPLERDVREFVDNLHAYARAVHIQFCSGKQAHDGVCSSTIELAEQADALFAAPAKPDARDAASGQPDRVILTMRLQAARAEIARLTKELEEARAKLGKMGHAAGLTCLDAEAQCDADRSRADAAEAQAKALREALTTARENLVHAAIQFASHYGEEDNTQRMRGAIAVLDHALAPTEPKAETEPMVFCGAVEPGHDGEHRRTPRCWYPHKAGEARPADWVNIPRAAPPPAETAGQKEGRARPLVYLACPYSHPDREVRAARWALANYAAGELMAKGEKVFSPISHTHPIAEAHDLPLGWDFWEAFDRAYIGHSHKLIVLTLDGWRESKGVQAEIGIAQETGIPVEYMDPPAPPSPSAEKPSQDVAGTSGESLAGLSKEGGETP